MLTRRAADSMANNEAAAKHMFKLLEFMRHELFVNGLQYPSPDEVAALHL
jgi:hypothetical protein